MSKWQSFCNGIVIWLAIPIAIRAVTHAPVSALWSEQTANELLWCGWLALAIIVRIDQRGKK